MTVRAPGDNVSVNVLRLFTFGGLGIEPDDGSVAPRLRPPRLALLAVLASAGERGVSRERLASLFWPDADERHARHSLRQALYALRNDLDREAVRSTGATLALDETEILADVAEFRAAIASGDRARAVGLVRGPFLDGFYVPGAPAFDRWVEEERARIANVTTSALLSLATEAMQANQKHAAVDWWRQLTLNDPLSGRFALGYLKALAACGNRAEALAFARQHQALVRRELEADPDPDIRRLEAELRAMPTPQVARQIDVAPRMATDHDQSPAIPVSATARPNAAMLRAIPSVRAARAFLGIATVAVLALFVTAAFGWLRRGDVPPVFAVGYIREDGVPDSMRVDGVLTDMLATNLARLQGLAVLANSRVLELMRPAQDSAAAYADAARRAGASELLEGRLLIARRSPLALEIRRVELRTGIVTDVYRVTAVSRIGLVDSLTQVIARRFRLASPRGSIADATTSSATAYRLYEEGMRAFYQYDAKAAQRLMRAALEEDSTFAMAAYYEAILALPSGDVLPDGRLVTDALQTALRLARRAPERERLTITANILAETLDPRALVVAESLTTRYPDDPRALMTLGKARWFAGDWPGAAAATERALVLDSIGDGHGQTMCQICRDLSQLGEVYLWWDSLPAAQRTARRFLRAEPKSWEPLYLSSLISARLSDSTSTYATFRRMTGSYGGDNRHLKLRLDLTLENYDEVEREVRPLLASSWMGEWGIGAWNLLIALRNGGRLREAMQFQRTGSLPGFPTPALESSGDAFNEAILALEHGDPRTAAKVFGERVHADLSKAMPGVRARHLAWNGTLEGWALAAAGDTASVRRLADSVERWGQGSAYGRDRKAHHYLRGLVLAAAGRHEDAAREFRAAIHSPTLGFTRVNYELARCLLRLGRPREAVAALQPALRGEVDASNLYVTRTDLHELLAQAFDAAAQPDSATAHYRAVIKAWKRADPVFHARRDLASAWLAKHASAGSH